MREFTQTNVEPGNCWQTAIACILEIDPAVLPDQVAIEGAPKKSYLNALNAFLEHHFGLMYSEVQDYQFGALTVRKPGWHLLCGPTVRTPSNNRQHVVVGRYGEVAWDPHPSRAGLTEVQRWGILAPMPERIKSWRNERRTGGGWEDLACACPACCGSSCPVLQA